MLVTDRQRTRGRDLVDLVARAVRGGVGIVQVREPDLPDDELRELLQRIREQTPSATTIVVNRSLRVARTAHVGLHLPARAGALGDVDLGDAPFGRSVHDDDEVRCALRDAPDYLIAGTIFATESKPGRAPGGVALLERICRQAHRTPVYAIGGVTVGRVPAVVHAGAHGVAVCGALLTASDPERLAEAMTLALEVASRSSAKR
jgi:thiamine-phosphate pyrophosphorylase